ncbi:hypothetical protein, partial [Acinetobacter ursingii]|uniref:hypothetical protein n=1 Tax=Acinetobacter ursingii TaxID=108980 RepID=UPI0032B34499
VNNGPKLIKLKINIPYKLTIELINSIQNRPLSSVYNEFIDYYQDFDRYIILDDDTQLNENYISRFETEDYYDLELPKIMNSSKEIYYPLKKWKVIGDEENFLINGREDIFSIGSGIIMSKKLVNSFLDKKKKVFNENFVFYGVDFSLFFEINKTDFPVLIITSYTQLLHDMSLHGEVSKDKKYQLYLNYAIQMRHYPSFLTLKTFLYSIYCLLRDKDVRKCYCFFKVFLVGKHPKSES